MEKKSKIDRVGRDYMMLMESKGYLSSTDEQETIKDLKKIGVTNISTVGTTKAKVGYGKDIKLKVSGKIATNTFNIKVIFEVKEVVRYVIYYLGLLSPLFYLKIISGTGGNRRYLKI